MLESPFLCFVVRVAIIILFLLLCSSLPQQSNAQPEENPIKHLVVLMMENRAFDHMCGYLKQTYNQNINGLNGNESNPANPSDEGSQLYYVNPNAPYVDPDPNHSNPGTLEEIWGQYAPSSVPVPPMNGFVKAAIDINIPPDAPLSCFNETSVPSISTLAQEFALIDDWFSDIPGPTICNRLYVFSATSDGSAENDKERMVIGYPQLSIFHNLVKANLSFEIFFEDFPTAFVLRDLREPPYLERFRPFEEFEKTARDGNLSNFTFLEPKYFSTDNDTHATDQHPSHDVALGEQLMAKVYKILRASPQWNNTALLITYDEHGGFYDHQPTPFQNIPNPDGKDSVNPPFNFTQLGVRVPAVLISPWINQGILLRGNNTGPTPSSQFSHSSVPATIKELFNLPTPFLTNRDAWAATFENAFFNRTSPRTDCPLEVPTPPSIKSPELLAVEHLQPINELQWLMIEIASTLGQTIPSPVDISELKTEQDGGYYVMDRMRAYFAERGLSLKY